MSKAKGDIDSKEDVVLLVDNFYARIKEDDLISHIFNDHMELSFEEHLPIMYSFWQSVLLGTASYKGNVMLSHIELNKKTPLKKEHFERWVSLWVDTTDNLFQGTRAEEAKKRAVIMKELMMFKIQQSGSSGFIQ